jgi:hypothetical protein
MKPRLKFEIIRAYGLYRVGDIIEPEGSFREGLMNGGWIRPVREEPQTATSQPTEAATIGTARRKPGRPRLSESRA